MTQGLSGKEFIRYSRQIMLPDVGEEGQQALLASRVMIVGMGGLGSPVSLYLAAAGVGHLTLCDHDSVDLSNLQRQILYRPEDCGKPKVECAQVALSTLNPGISIETVASPVEQMDGDKPLDLVLDCTDNMAARHWLNRYCQRRRLPFISGAALGWEGQLMTFDFRHGQTPCFACSVVEGSNEPTATCSTVGIMGPVLGVVGSLQATSAISLLLGHALPHGKMQRYDGSRSRWQTFTIQPNPDCHCGQSQ